MTAGDRVAIYLPMIPEAVFAMLACARLGLAHGVVFAGFSAEALRSRIGDAQARVVITADGQYRRGTPVPLKAAVDEAVAAADSPGGACAGGPPHRHRHHLDRQGPVVARTGRHPTRTHTPQGFPAEQPLFVLYTSGTTGKPKGIVHTSGGYLTQAAYTHHAVFDHKPDTDVYWCTADIGWVTGHSYIVYGPLANRATQVIYEGTPNTPHEGRHWEIIDKYRVSIYYTAPTLIRTFMKWGADIPGEVQAGLAAGPRVSVGEPINPEAWMWYRTTIGHDNCPIVDTWWQTETGGIMISPLPGVTATKPGSAMTPLPGISAIIVNDEGHPVGNGEGGYLVIDKPWPAMLRTIFGDDDRYKDTYWSRFADQGYYFAGDGAKYDTDRRALAARPGRRRDEHQRPPDLHHRSRIRPRLPPRRRRGRRRRRRRRDDRTGHRRVRHPPRHRRRTPTPSSRNSKPTSPRKSGPSPNPRQILVVPELPKTRSGKIMRRLLRDIAENREVGDASTLQDSAVMNLINSGLSGAKSD